MPGGGGTALIVDQGYVGNTPYAASPLLQGYVPGGAGVWPRSASGTLTLSGTASALRSPSRSASGALALSGVASGVRVMARAAAPATVSFLAFANRGVVHTATASGALALAGSAASNRLLGKSASGALSLSGTASATLGHVDTATAPTHVYWVALATARHDLLRPAGPGVVAFAGVASQTTVRAPGVGVGHLALSGSASASRVATPAASGSLALSGSAVAADYHTYVESPSGTLTLSASVDISQSILHRRFAIPGIYLGSFAVGDEVSVLVQPLDRNGLPVVPDGGLVQAKVYGPGTTLYASFALAPADPNRPAGPYVGSFVITPAYPVGPAAVVYTYTDAAGFDAATRVDTLTVVAADGSGRVISLFYFVRPEATYVLAHLSDGTVDVGRNPTLPG